MTEIKNHGHLDHYTAFYRHHKTGRPILQPLSFYDQTDIETHNRDHEFICGDHFLTASIDKELTKDKIVYLPSGKWFNYWTNQVLSGGQEVTITYDRNTFPLMVKAGAIVPFYPVQQYVDEKEVDTLELKVYFKKGAETSYLYEDAHDGYQYEDGDISYRTFDLEGGDSNLKITQTIEGGFQPTWRKYHINLIGLSGQANNIVVDGVEVGAEHVEVPADFKTVEISWS